MKAGNPNATDLAQRDALREPVLRHLAGQSLDEHFRTYGMYPPSHVGRDGAAAFTVHPDVQLADLLETVGQLLRQARAITSALACDAGLDEATSDLADGVCYLLQQAQGLHSLVWPVVADAVLDHGTGPQRDDGDTA